MVTILNLDQIIKTYQILKNYLRIIQHQDKQNYCKPHYRSKDLKNTTLLKEKGVCKELATTIKETLHEKSAQKKEGTLCKYLLFYYLSEFIPHRSQTDLKYAPSCHV